MNKQESLYSMLNLVLVLELTQELNDKLEGSKEYRQEIKFHSKGLKTEIEKILGNNLKKCFDTDSEIYLNVQRNLDTMIESLHKMCIDLQPIDFMYINQMINSYLENKDFFKENFDVEVIKIKGK